MDDDKITNDTDEHHRAKERIKDALVAQAEAELRATRQNVRDQHRAAELDPDSSYSIDDEYQSDEAGDLAGSLRGR